MRALIASLLFVASVAHAVPIEGFGQNVTGGAGGRVIRVGPSNTDLLNGVVAANQGNVVLSLSPGHEYVFNNLPAIYGSNVTIEGNGATLRTGSGRVLWFENSQNILVRNVCLRDGYDNLQFKHVKHFAATNISSTGATDDGVSISFGSQYGTVQHAFLAGNTRHIFMRYKSSGDQINAVTLANIWCMKGNIRCPWVSGGGTPAEPVDVRNLVSQDWTAWGSNISPDGTNPDTATKSYVNFVGAWFSLSPRALVQGAKRDFAVRWDANTRVYVDALSYGSNTQPRAGLPVTEAAPFPAPSVVPKSRAFDVMAQAGCRPNGTWSELDLRYVQMVDGWSVGNTNPLKSYEVS